MKFQNKLTPDSSFFHLSGPVEDRRLNMTIYYECGLYDTLSTEPLVIRDQFDFHRDAAYIMRPWLETAFDGLLTHE